MGVLAAQAAAYAAVDHGCHRVAAQRVRVVPDRERRAAGEPDARVVAGAGVLVDPVFDSDHPFTPFECLGCSWLETSLPLELALALGDDDLEPSLLGRHRLLVGLRNFA